MNRLLLKLVIVLVVAVMVVLIRVLIRAIRSRARAKGYTSALPPPPRGAATSTRKPVLLGVAGVYKGSMVPLDGGPIVIGRDPSAANLVFPDEQRTISSKHCLIKVADGRFYLEDCYSTNGTYLANGRAVTPGQVIELKAGERFAIGDRKNSFEVTFR